MSIKKVTSELRVSFRLVGIASFVLLSAGPASPQSVSQRLERLERRVSELEAASQPTFIRVQCALGQTVGAALARANTRTGPVTIEVAGICMEGGLIVGQDDVTIRGAMPGDGITGPGGRGSQILSVRGQRVLLEDLTLQTTGDFGSAIGASNGASFTGTRLHLTLQDRSTVVAVSSNASATLTDSVIDGCEVGAYVDDGNLSVVGNSGAGALFENCSENGILIRGGRVTLYGKVELQNSSVFVSDGGALVSMGTEVLIEGHGANGINVLGGTVVLEGGTTIRDTGLGIRADDASILLAMDAQVSGNGVDGIRATNGSRVHLQSGALLEDNGGNGLVLEGGSSSANYGALIRNNTGSGVHVKDTSVMVGFGPGQIIGNSAWGILCDAPPSVAQVHGDLGNVSGNTSGQVSCP